MSSLARHLDAAARATGRGEDAAAVRHLRRVVRLAPNIPAFWGLLGDRLLAQDAFDAAIRAYRRSLELHDAQHEDADCPDCIRTVAAVHAALGTAFAGAGDLEEAGRELGMALKLDPSPENWLSVGELEATRGRPERARACYRRALRADKGFVPALLRLADLDIWRHPKRVRRLCERILDLEPGHPDALTTLAATHMQLEAWDKAADCLDAVLRAAPIARAWVYRGHLHMQAGEVDRARQAYARAQRLDPGDVHPLYALGDLEWDEGNLDAAECAYREARTLDPGSADAMLRLARFLFDVRGEREEAVALARRGLDLAPHHPWADAIRAWWEPAEDDPKPA